MIRVGYSLGMRDIADPRASTLAPQLVVQMDGASRDYVLLPVIFRLSLHNFEQYKYRRHEFVLVASAVPELLIVPTDVAN